MTGTRSKLILFTCATVVSSVFNPAVVAQALSPVEQIGSPNADSVEQISDGATNIIAPMRTEPRQSVMTVGPTLAERTPDAAQLTEETGLMRTSTQVSTRERSSAGSAPLSKPSQGRRTAAVVRLAGDDRCDPSNRQSSTIKSCALVIEKRADEFAPREAMPLSPEQRILIEQQRSANAYRSKNASRRLATSGTASDTLESQGIASLVLHAPSPDKAPEPIDDQNGLDAAAALVKGVLGQIIAPPAP